MMKIKFGNRRIINKTKKNIKKIKNKKKISRLDLGQRQ